MRERRSPLPARVVAAPTARIGTTLAARIGDARAVAARTARIGDARTFTTPVVAALAAVIAVVATLAWMPATATAQVSPGELAAAHAFLDGPLDCMKCHAKGEGGLDRQCLDCHREIAATLAQKSGLHGRGGLGSGCARCHPDHAGRDFQMIAWEEGSAEAFDHGRTGYRLEGAHREAGCRDCHRASNAKSAIAKLSPRKDLSRGYVGLTAACADCHEDPHRAELGRDCASCHVVAAWKPASGFDHQRSDYPLTGRHADAACDDCHRSPRLSTPAGDDGRPIARWKPLDHAQCSSCHEDTHRGRLGADCASCHVTRSFLETDRDRFDHERTRYPLRGEHRSVECASCHDPKAGPASKRPRFESCGDCHRGAHEATLASRWGDCAACHDVGGFARSTWTAAAHAKTGYALEGRHAGVDCGSCHPKTRGASGLGASRVQLRPRHAACTDCHADPHGGRFEASTSRRGPSACTDCHGMSGFRPARYGIDEHETTDFPLRGAHRATPCVDCHAELGGGSQPALRSRGSSSAGLRPRGASQPGLRYRGVSQAGLRSRGPGATLDFREPHARCDDCHLTPHGTQFEGRGDCVTCHGLDAFAPASAFDHETMSAFPLKGAHARVACADCHPSRVLEDRTREVTWRPVAHACRDCHADTKAEEPSLPGSPGEAP